MIEKKSFWAGILFIIAAVCQFFNLIYFLIDGWYVSSYYYFNIAFMIIAGIIMLKGVPKAKYIFFAIYGVINLATCLFVFSHLSYIQVLDLLICAGISFKFYLIDNNKIEIEKKIRYIPLAIEGLLIVLLIIRLFSYYFSVYTIYDIIDTLISRVPFILVCLSTTLELYHKKKNKDPNEIIAKNTEKKNCQNYISIPKHILLLFFTFGIWQLIWVARTTRFLRRDNKGDIGSTGAVLLFLFVPIYTIIWYYNFSKRTDEMAREVGLGLESVSTNLVLALFSPIVVPIIMQNNINKVIEWSEKEQNIKG